MGKDVGKQRQKQNLLINWKYRANPFNSKEIFYFQLGGDEEEEQAIRHRLV